MKLKLILCFLGIHDWEITKWSMFKDIKCKHIYQEGFDRSCEVCGKRQTLEKPKKYHPSKWVWTNVRKLNN